MKSTLLCAILIGGGTLAVAQDGSFSDLAARAAGARQANDIQGALGLYRQALALNPKWQEGWWMAGLLLYEGDHYEEAVGDFKHLLELRPGAGPALALLGLCEYETGHYDDSLEHIHSGLAAGIGGQDQMKVVLQFHEALILTKKGRFYDGMRKYSEFIPAEVRDDQVLLGAGLTALHRALTPAEIPSGRQELYRDAGRALAAWLNGDSTAAKSRFEALASRYADDPNAHYAYGYFLFGKDGDAAIVEWQKALTLEPAHAESHAMLAWVYSQRDEWERAFPHAQAAVEKDRDSTVAQIVIGRYLVKGGRVDKGIAALEHAIRVEPTNLEAHLALATAYSEAGRRAESQRERQFCMKMQAEAASVAQP